MGAPLLSSAHRCLRRCAFGPYVRFSPARTRLKISTMQKMHTGVQNTQQPTIWNSIFGEALGCVRLGFQFGIAIARPKIAHCHSTLDMHAHNSKIRAHYLSKRRRKNTHDVESTRYARFLRKPLPTDLPATMVVSPLHFHVSWRMRMCPLFS